MEPMEETIIWTLARNQVVFLPVVRTSQTMRLKEFSTEVQTSSTNTAGKESMPSQWCDKTSLTWDTRARTKEIPSQRHGTILGIVETPI